MKVLQLLIGLPSYKGIITNNGSLSGSMNITFSGLEINEENRVLYW